MRRVIIIAVMLAFAARAQDAASWWNALAAGGAAFNPLSISGCLAWFDASDSSTVVSSEGRVSEWHCKAQSDYAAPVSVNHPLYVANGKNGLGVVRFASVGYYTSEGLTVSRTFNATNYSVFAVAMMHYTAGDVVPYDRVVAVDRLPSEKDYISTDTFIFCGFTPTERGATPPVFFSYRYNSDVCVNSIAYDRYYVAAVVRNGTAVTTWLNGSTTLISNATSPLPLNSTRLLLGCSSDTYDSELNGDIAEVIIYEGNLTDENRIAVQNYLSRKWGITVTP